jgi:putative transposase
MGLDIRRSSIRYRGRPSTSIDPRLANEIRKLATAHPRWGWRRIHAYLRNEGIAVNHKKVLRIYRTLNLRVPQRKRNKLRVARKALPTTSHQNQRWAMDFMHVKIANEYPARVLTVIDTFTRMCLALEVGVKMPATTVTRVLDKVVAQNQLPECIRMDNGPEYRGRILERWSRTNGVKLEFIRPAKPYENGHCESFNGRLRDECLNQNWFDSINHAQEILDEWRYEYNNKRPHSSLHYMTPANFKNHLPRLP